MLHGRLGGPGEFHNTIVSFIGPRGKQNPR
jgi:hypothetical protein